VLFLSVPPVDEAEGEAEATTTLTRVSCSYLDAAGGTEVTVTAPDTVVRRTAELDAVERSVEVVRERVRDGGHRGGAGRGGAGLVPGGRGHSGEQAARGGGVRGGARRGPHEPGAGTGAAGDARARVEQGGVRAVGNKVA
jgi:hypothetical protein